MHVNNNIMFLVQVSYYCYAITVLFLSGDIETNPGPGVTQTLNICHWNLNSIAADNFVKIPLLQAYLTAHNIDIVCLSETFLNSSLLDDDSRLGLDGYSLIRDDHPSDLKKGGVCIFYKNHLPLTRVSSITLLKECLVCELKVGTKKCFITVLYRTPSQSIEEFQEFKKNLEQTIININNRNPYISMFTGDFNARNTNWWVDDTDNTEGLDIDEISRHYGLKQLINNPTHILPNSASCIDLIFTSQPNLITESGVHSSLFPRCHHQVIFAKINFKVYFPPSYERLIWDYPKANVELIRRSLSEVDWENSLSGLHVNDQVKFLTNCITNVFKFFVPNKTIVCKDKDPPWMNNEIKNACLNKAKIYRHYVKNGRRTADQNELQNAATYSSNLISDAKTRYLSNLGDKLNNPLIGPKAYWSILNKFLHKRKIPIIPPISFNDNFITDVSEKARIFNEFFAAQCTLIQNVSTLPAFCLKTECEINNIIFKETDILSIIRSLNINKAHGWDNLSIRMIKMCDDVLVKPLMIIFETALLTGNYPEQWKKAHVVPVHKKDNKNLLNNYRPISLLPICGKIFEKCIYNTLYSYLENNNIFSHCQSGFRKNDSCISQLLAITHDIFKNFDACPTLETRGVFLDISKAFDRVWHEGLIFKLKSYGIKGPLLSLIASFLSDRFQRVVLNGECSTWKEVLAGVPQGSILGPLFFLVFINDLPDHLRSNVKIFADDTSLFSVMKDNLRGSNILNDDLQLIANWAEQWKMSFNPDPCKQATEIVFSTKLIDTQLPPLTFNSNVVCSKQSHKHLGVILDKKLSFNHHLKEKISKANKGIGLITRLYRYLPRHTLLCIYKSFVRPHLDYGDIIYDNPSNESFCQRIESVQYNAALAITGAIRGTSREKLYNELGLESLSDRRWYRRLSFFYKVKNEQSATYLNENLPTAVTHFYNARTNRNFHTFKARTERFQFSFFPYCANQWNKLDPEIRNSPTVISFKRSLLHFIRPTAHSIFKIHDPRGLKLLTRLRVGLSHLREHKFRHNFNDTINPSCVCGTNSRETVEHFILHCPIYLTYRCILFDNLRQTISVLPFKSSFLVKVLLYGTEQLDSVSNNKILSFTISFLLMSKRFDGPLL